MASKTRCHPLTSSHADLLSTSLPSRSIITAGGVGVTHLHLPFETHRTLFSGPGVRQPVHLHSQPIILLVTFSKCVCVFTVLVSRGSGWDGVMLELHGVMVWVLSVR